MPCEVFMILDIQAGLISSSSSKAASAAAENNQLTALIKGPGHRLNIRKDVLL